MTIVTKLTDKKKEKEVPLVQHVSLNLFLLFSIFTYNLSLYFFVNLNLNPNRIVLITPGNFLENVWIRFYGFFASQLRKFQYFVKNHWIFLFLFFSLMIKLVMWKLYQSIKKSISICIIRYHPRIRFILM